MADITRILGSQAWYTAIDTLNDDILLGVFNDYRLSDEDSWNDRLGWCKLSHVCRRWRNLVCSSALYLSIRIRCTNGTPLVTTLDHLPPIPLLVEYRYIAATRSRKDELGVHHALQLRDRIRSLVLHLPSSTLHKLLDPMEGPFLILDHLSLSFTDDEITGLILPKTFMAPNLRHLTLVGVGLPKGLSLLSSTLSLVSLTLTNIRASGYFPPRLLVTRLQSLPQLEELSIGFFDPIPRPSAEGELLGKRGIPLTLPNLKLLKFKGVSSFLERLVAQLRTPLLDQLSITLFYQIAFTLPHLSNFINITERIKPKTAEVNFIGDGFSIVTYKSTIPIRKTFDLLVVCKQLDWQIDCASQICSTLVHTLSGVEQLTLDFYEPVLPTQWQNGEIDGTTWHELLMPFVGVKRLQICAAISDELSRALQVDEIGLFPGFLPCLQVLRYPRGQANDLFSLFLDARQAMGRPVFSAPTPPVIPTLPTPIPGPLVAPFGSRTSRSIPFPRRPWTSSS